VQPILVATEPLLLVSYEHLKAQLSFEIEPIALDEETAFDLNAPVFGKAYKQKPDTARETKAKEMQKTGTEGIAHSFITGENPFARQRTGTRIEVDTVQTYDIIITATEAAKRIKARIGFVPDGFIAEMKKQYPEGVPVNQIDDIAQFYLNGQSAVKMA
jgi:hypothetical protein